MTALRKKKTPSIHTVLKKHVFSVLAKDKL